jgi:NADH-quinone oxidoreductase subunit D
VSELEEKPVEIQGRKAEPEFREQHPELEKDYITEEFWVNMGPQHPSTHGVLRLVLKLDGEVIIDCVPQIGYLHRGMEKMAEYRTYNQYLPFLDRVDYVSGMLMELCYAIAVEKLAGIEVPERAEYIRVIVAELNRIASHLVWLGVLALDLGALTPFLYCFREREVVLELFEMLTGQRLTYNYIRFGGVEFDIKEAVNPNMPDKFLGIRVKKGGGKGVDFITLLAKFVEIFPKRIDDYEAILTYNEIFLERMAGIGYLPLDVALSYSVTGPNVRSSGYPYDIRKAEPYSVYARVYEGTGIKVPTGEKGDCWDRYKVRLQEMRDSCKMIRWCLDNMPDGPVRSKVARVVKVPEGEIYVRVEGPRGEFGVYLISNGTTKPERLKLRGASFSNLSVLPYMVRGYMIADLIAIFGSLDIILPDCDR